MARKQLNNTKKENIYWYKDGKEKKYAYRYRFYDHSGKRREKSKQGFSTDRDAELALTELKADILKGNLQQVDNQNLTISSWMEMWYNQNVSKWKISTMEQYSYAINQHIVPCIGHVKISRLSRSIYQEFIDSLATKYSTSTVRTVHAVFNGAINAAVEEEILVRNKIAKANLPRFESRRSELKEHDFLNEEELIHFLTYVKEKESMTHYTLALLLASLGLRKGEAIALRWDNIDFDNSEITIINTRDHLGERSAKTDNSVRRIDLNETLTKQLKKYKVWCIERKLAFGMPLNQDDYVIMNENTCEGVSRSFPNDLTQRAFEEGVIKRITPHGLRHTCASILISKGIPITTVAKILGDTVETVSKVYAHSLRQKEKEAAKVMEGIINF